MKIKIESFLFGANHSWSIVDKNIGIALLKKGHEVHFVSTDGLLKKYTPEFFIPYIRLDSKVKDKDDRPLKNEIGSFPEMDKEYDMQISYTAMRNFKSYLRSGIKNRFSIWNYESTILPKGFTKYYKHTDKFCPSSEFSAKIFEDNGVPREHMKVIPHGINIDEYSSDEVYPLKTNKKYKILANIAQPHIRKNIAGLFESYGRAFTKKDDVCLVAKVSIKNLKDSDRKYQFDVDFNELYRNFCKKHPDHAEVEILKDYIPSMVSIYNAVDIVYSTTFAECFWLPGLEAMATDNVVIAPNWGGQLEYMNDGNSLLIETKRTRCPREMQYWSASPYAEMGVPDLDDAAAKLQLAVNNYDNLINKFRPGMQMMVNKLTWDWVAQEFLDLCV